jgi:hypothetical protein
MFDILTWIDWGIIAVAIVAVVGFIIYFSKHTYDEVLKEIEETVIWVERNMIHGVGVDKLEQATVIIRERFKDKSWIVRLIIRGLKANTGEKIVNAIQDVIEKLNSFAKKEEE